MKVILGLIIGAAVAGGVLEYLSLPVAGINQSGKCVYLVVKGEKLPCDHLPPKYIKEHVAGW